MEEAPRRTLSASTPRHPPLVRTSPPRRAKRRGGSRDARAERAPPRPPEAWRRTRRLREKALPPLQPAVPDGRAEDGDPPPCVTAPRSPPPPPSPLLRPPAWPRPEGKGLRRQATAGRGRDGTRLPHPRRATEGERETNRPRETEEKTIPPPTTTRSFGRPRGGRGDRPRDARASDTVACERACDGKARRDKPLCRGLTFNRSQRGSCSATYETPTQKQVVYEWFSARFHTNVRST